MLHGRGASRVQAGDVVLVWGAAGGLGSMAIQVARTAGALPVAVVSSDEKGEYCRKLGAVGVVDRRQFDHWGLMPTWRDAQAYDRWLAGVRRFGRAIWDVVGARRNPRIVVEHPGEETLPTSVFVCEAGGMVVTCAGTTGYNRGVDLRHLWMRQKRLQGSHFANIAECRTLNDLVARGVIDPCAGTLEIADYDHLTMLSRFLAAEMGVPFMPVNSLLGTDMCDRPEVQWAMVQDPWDAQRRALVVPALAPDVSIVHVQQADREGNLVIDGLLHHEPEMIRASRVTIATCDRLVEPEEFRRSARATIPGVFIAAVVELPNGAYPTASHGCYDYDAAHIAMYQEAAREGGTRFAAYIERYVLDVSSHAQFLDRARGDAKWHGSASRDGWPGRPPFAGRYIANPP